MENKGNLILSEMFPQAFVWVLLREKKDGEIMKELASENNLRKKFSRRCIE